MLGIPLLSTYIQRIVKVQSVSDSVDWLNYYCTSLLLAFFALAISAKQYFGSPIQCFTPNEFKGSWEKYAENYCFVSNAYYVPFKDEIPRDLIQRQDQISYYRWVPVVLALQALLFWLPNWLWNILHKQTAINPRGLLNEAEKSRRLYGVDRDKEIGQIASFVSDTLSTFLPDEKYGYWSRRSLGLNATFLYLTLKLLYVLNCFGQLIILNRFLGGEFHSWAWKTVIDLFKGTDWGESPLFPRVILCDFSIRSLANLQRHTIQCVMMLNMINEKLYFFLNFWFLFVGIVTLVNFFYYFAILLLPKMRTNFVRQNINKHEQKLRGFGRRELRRYVQFRLHPDGILLLLFMRQQIGGRFTYDLLNELLRLHWLAQTTGILRHSKLDDHIDKGTDGFESTNSPASTKARQGDVFLLDDQQEDSFSRQNTYKPTVYGHLLGYTNNKNMDIQTSSMPISQVFSTMNLTAFNSVSLLRAISGTASPTNVGLPSKLTENQYSAPPKLQLIDGNDDTRTQSKEHYVNATPLMQSRRSKSPLVTGLGSISGKRSTSHPLDSLDSQTNKDDVKTINNNETNISFDV